MYFFGIFLTVLISSVNSAVDCSKRPSFTDAKTCCNIPEPNFSSFEAQCRSQQILNQRVPSPCLLECAFNESNALEGDDLNQANARKMLEALLPGHPDFVEAYANGFEKCAPVVKKRIAEFKTKQRGPLPKGPNMPNCPLLGTFYAMCAHKNVFIACPSSAWTSTSVCENAREYASSCEPQLGGLGGRRGGRNKNQRGQRGRREVTAQEEITNPNSVDQNSGQGLCSQGFAGGNRRFGRQNQGYGPARNSFPNQNQAYGPVQGYGVARGNGPARGYGAGQGYGPGQVNGVAQSQGYGPGQVNGVPHGQGYGPGIRYNQGQGSRQGLGRGQMQGQPQGQYQGQAIDQPIG